VQISNKISRLKSKLKLCRNRPLDKQWFISVKFLFCRLQHKNQSATDLAVSTTDVHLGPGAHWDAGGSRAGRRSAGNTAWQSVSAHWEVVSCNLAKWAMAEFIALSSESESDEEMDTLLLLYLTSKRQNSVWKNEYMKKEKLAVNSLWRPNSLLNSSRTTSV